jgi:hypothetical protein
MQTAFFRAAIFVAALAFLGGRDSRSEIIYDNMQAVGTRFFPSLNEHGDEIRLAGEGRRVREFLLEYYADFRVAVNPTARIRFYRNDGPGQFPSPSTMLYDSGEIALVKGYQIIRLEGIAVDVPNAFTWTVAFQGLTGAVGEQAGLLFSDPPAIGTSFDDFWMFTSKGWGLFRVGPDVKANFAARVLAFDVEKLSMHRQGANLVLEWPAGLALYSAAEVTGPWEPVSGATSPWQAQLQEGGQRFWTAREAGLAPPAPLQVRVAGDSLLLEWGGNQLLQVAGSVSGPWETVSGAVSPYAAPRQPGETRFWRLVPVP